MRGLRRLFIRHFMHVAFTVCYREAYKSLGISYPAFITKKRHRTAMMVDSIIQMPAAKNENL